MRKEELDTLLSMISKLKPHEWNQIVHYVQKKYSSKQASVPMPSMEELSDYSANLDFPGLMKSQSEGEILMEENKVKDLINALNLVNEQMVQKKEISTIAVAVKLEGLDQINEELDKVLNKLEKANSLADELASKIKDLCSK